MFPYRRCCQGRTSVLLESKAEESNVLVADGVEHAGDHALHEAVLLVVVHVDNLHTPWARDRDHNRT